MVPLGNMEPTSSDLTLKAGWVQVLLPVEDGVHVGAREALPPRTAMAPVWYSFWWRVRAAGQS